MVRTKADGALRVAAGGKAPKKSVNRVYDSPSPTEKVGKDNFPVNRYCPRETPSWQKKITSFYEMGAKANKSCQVSERETADQNAMEEATVVPNEVEPAVNGKSKRSITELEESDDACHDEDAPSSKKFKSNNNMEIDPAGKISLSTDQNEEAKDSNTMETDD
ncbi:hypothetical protein QAD02_014333 [Eretmocerus hayati]|uniref:Uncharacterized protein n=1 Tax=Eretmocerus hayati TaxID=131215 RepID=A0ACC2P516_9HYME|nr:hypothetical protein QAD02_014333 [Eretmocerus hayati]